MNKEDAIRLVRSAYPDKDIGKIRETDRYFLVSVLPRSSNRNGVVRLALFDDGLKAVDKATKKVFTYNPIRHSTGGETHGM